MKEINIVFIVLVAIVGLVWYLEEERMIQENLKKGTNFADLEVGDNLRLWDVSLTFLGETEGGIRCDDFLTRQFQEECKKLKFLAFKINESKVPFVVLQGRENAFIALEGTVNFGLKRYYSANATKKETTVIFSDKGYLSVDSLREFYKIRYSDSFKNLTRFKVDVLDEDKDENITLWAFMELGDSYSYSYSYGPPESK